MAQWGKDKTPSQTQQFDPNQQYSPQSAQTPGYPGTPSAYFNQYGGGTYPRQIVTPDSVVNASPRFV